MVEEDAAPEKPWWRTWHGQPEWAKRMNDPSPRIGRWMFGIAVAMLIVGFGGIFLGFHTGALAGASGGLLVTGYRAMRGKPPSRATGRQRVVVGAVVLVALIPLAVLIIQSRDEPDGFGHWLPATTPVVVAAGATPTGGTWKLEAYFNKDRDVCTRVSDAPAPETRLPTDAPMMRSGGGSASGCNTKLPLSTSGSGGQRVRVIVGVAPLDASAVRLLRCDGSVRSVVPNKAAGEFGRAFFGFAVESGTARRVVVIGPRGKRVAQEDLAEYRIIGEGDDRDLKKFNACDAPAEAVSLSTPSWCETEREKSFLRADPAVAAPGSIVQFWYTGIATTAMTGHDPARFGPTTAAAPTHRFDPNDVSDDLSMKRIGEVEGGTVIPLVGYSGAAFFRARIPEDATPGSNSVCWRGTFSGKQIAIIGLVLVFTGPGDADSGISSN